ncbi:MAG: PilT/PilU family type 4a pilus ATPase [Bacilli bacterium]
METQPAQRYKDLLLEMLHITNKEGASDLHIVADSLPIIRVNGELVRIEHMNVITKDEAYGICEYITSDFIDKNVKDCYELDLAFGIEDLGRYRLNIYKQQDSLALAIRSLPLGIRDFKQLGIPLAVSRLAYKNNGLVLVTGPTGSGKSTTLAALLDLINQDRSCHIITIEDPIEYIYDHKSSLVTQREIGRDTKTFSDALRAAMREDPDVILVGEMRDEETIQIALTAAETGHLVFSTLHTVGAAKTIDRIVDTFESGKQNQIRSQLSTVLQGVVSQVLIPRLDNQGRVLACEIMFNTPAIRNLIREGKPHQIANVMQTSINLDMITLDNDLIRLFKTKTISYDKAVSNAQNPQTVLNAIGERRV